MRNALRWYHDRHWLLRGGLRIMALLAVVLVVLFPRFWLIPQWLQRWSNPAALIEPDHPGLAPLEAAARTQIRKQGITADRAAFLAVQNLVLEQIPYKHDWDNSGQVDHLPSVSEVLAAGADDCDGQAIMIASLLQRMGYEAHLVTDVLHVWVQGPRAAALDQGGTPSVMIKERPKIRVNKQLAANLTKGLTYGIQVFPAWRQLVLMTAIVLFVRPARSARVRGVVGIALILAGWIVLRSIPFAAHPAIPFLCYGGAVVGLVMVVWPKRRLTRTQASEYESVIEQ